VVKAFAQYAQVKFNTPAKVTGFQLGATVPVYTNGTVMASYGEAKVSGANAKGKMLSVGYDHAISKRTSVYAAVNQVKVTNTSPNGKNFAVGVKHAF